MADGWRVWDMTLLDILLFILSRPVLADDGFIPIMYLPIRPI